MDTPSPMLPTAPTGSRGIPAPRAEEDVEGGSSSKQKLLVTGMVFVSFFIFGTVRTPPPGVNEPHYLSKAKHYWDADFCPGDFFLDSSNAHRLFYQTVGLLTRWLTFEQTAWIGRLAGYLLLAGGWTAFVSALVPGRWAGLWSAWAFLAISAAGNFSGEWIVGGVEAKVFAYACVFAAMACMCRGLVRRAAVFGGLAVSFHPVVGAWSAIAATFATIALWAGAGKDETKEQPLMPPRPPAPDLLLAGVLFVLCSLPGVLPVLQLIGGDTAKADAIHVFYRLPHHLVPGRFAWTGYLCYLLLIGFWWVCRRRAGFKTGETWFAWFVVASVLIAVCGLLVGWGIQPDSDDPLTTLRVKLLTFYPFRLFDVAVPWACALALAGLAWRYVNGELPDSHPGDERFGRSNISAPSETHFRSQIVSGVYDWIACESGSRRQQRSFWLFGTLMVVALVLPAPERNASRMGPSRRADWIDACRWIAGETPRDALFLTPTHEAWAFHWYAQRAAYVIYKDCPQDAAGILEWDRRQRYVQHWARVSFATGNRYTLDELRQLQEQTGITHIITRRLGPLELQPIYRNRTYRIYQLPVAGRSGQRS